MGIIKNFFKGFAFKYLKSTIVEGIVISLIKELVKRTDSEIDDNVYDIVFTKTRLRK